MKSRTLTCITAMTLFATLAVPVRLPAQEQEQNKQQPRYKLIDLGAFGGPASYLAGRGPALQVLNNRGTVAGWADTSTPDPHPGFCFNPDCFVSHTFQWHHGALTDLGALPGVNSSGGNWINARGDIVGLSQNGIIDPLTGFPETVAVLWKDGQIVNLGTLGGNDSVAQAINNRGQVVGAALNTIPDPFSFLATEIRAFQWQNGVMQDLGTLGGPEAWALLVNERGQVAGWALTNSTANPVTNFPTLDPFLWEKGTMQDLGTLGGTSGVPWALNNRGQVVGQSNMAGDLTYHPFLWDQGVLRDLGTFGGDNGLAIWINDDGEVLGKADLPGSQTHDAFFWSNGVMTDLGLLKGDRCTVANSINSRKQIVGCSSDCITCLHAFLWERGSIVDLNTLVPPNSGLQLAVALNINDRGEIAGLGVLPGSGCGDPFACGHAFLLTPCEGEHADASGCEDDAEGTTSAIQNTSVSVTQSRTTAPQGNTALKSRSRRMLLPFGRALEP